MKISAVIICLNEEANIEKCLKSLQWVNEIVVYDSGSTDQTVSLAKKMGAKVISGPWLGFGPTKHKATSEVTSDWVLSLDADEQCSEELQKEINNLLQNNLLNSEYLYQIPRLSFYLNTWIKHGGWYPDAQARLFNKTVYQWNLEPIHEKVVRLSTQHSPEPSHIQRLKNNLFHDVFKNIEHQVQTNNRYSSLQAQKMFAQKKSFSWFHFLTKPYVKFIECYVLKLGFLDGWAGYAIARNAAYSALLKWMKLKELYDNELYDNEFHGKAFYQVKKK